MDSKNLITNLIGLWSNIITGQFQKSDGALPLKTAIFDQFAEINGTIISIHNLELLRAEYVTPNVTKILGLTPQMVIERGNDYFMSRLIEAHQPYLNMLFGFIQEIAQREKQLDFVKMRVCVCGIQYKTERDELIKLLLDYNPLPPAHKTDKLTHTLGLLSNVSHLYKREDFWIRIVYETEQGEKKMMAYHPDYEHILHDDFISTREFDILTHLYQGHETKEIAQKLGISRNTVNNHRQKLLDKIGAKDTTALIQLASRICYK